MDQIKKDDHQAPAVAVVDNSDPEYAIIIEDIKDEKLIESQQCLFEALKRPNLNEKKAYQITSNKCKIIFRNEQHRNKALEKEETIKTTFDIQLKSLSAIQIISLSF